MTQGGEEEAKLQLKLEYMSGAVAQEGSDPPVGRHLLLPVQLRILPSVQVNALLDPEYSCWTLSSVVGPFGQLLDMLAN